MTITVKSGQLSVDFPDGTDDETIRRVMLRATGGDGSEARAQPKAPPVSTLEAAGRGAIQGATFGFGDEIYAGAVGAYDALKGGSFSDTYNRELGDVRAANERARQSNPIPFIGGELVGGMALPLGALGTAARGATLAQRSMQSAKTGAALGGVYGFGTAQGGEGSIIDQAGNRAIAAIPGVVGGAAVGAVAPAAVDLASAALKPVSNAVRAFANPSSVAESKVIEALARDAPELAPSRAVEMAQDRLARARQTKPDAMLADVGGQNTRDLLRAASNMPSRSGQRLQASLDRRQAWQWSRIENDVADTLADGNAFTGAMEEITKRVSEVGKTEFERAFSRPWNVTANDPLARFLSERPFMRRLVEKTAENYEGMTGQNLMEMRPWEIMHRVKMQIDSEIGGLKRGNLDSKANWDLRGLVQLKKEFVDLIGQRNGSYRSALYKYGDEAGLRTALERGAEEFNTASRLDLRAALQGMTEPERRMYRMGAARSLFDQIEKGNVMRDRTDSLFSSAEIQMKLAVLYPDQAARRDLQKRLILEARMADTRKAVQGNSTTARQLAQGQEAGQPLQGVVAVANATSGKLTPALQWLSRQTQAFSGLTPQVADKIIERLMAQTPQHMQMRLMAEIGRAAKEPARRDALVRRIVQGAAPLMGNATPAQSF